MTHTEQTQKRATESDHTTIAAMAAELMASVNRACPPIPYTITIGQLEQVADIWARYGQKAAEEVAFVLGVVVAWTAEENRTLRERYEKDHGSPSLESIVEYFRSGYIQTVASI